MCAAHLSFCRAQLYPTDRGAKQTVLNMKKPRRPQELHIYYDVPPGRCMTTAARLRRQFVAFTVKYKLTSGFFYIFSLLFKFS